MPDTDAQPSTPVTLNTPGTLAQPPQQPPAQTPGLGQGGETVRLGGIDPSRLDPQLKSLYDSMYGDYQQKTTAIANERKEWESSRKEWETQKSKYSDLERKFAEYENQAKIWQQWLPLLNGLNQPGRLELANRIARGEDIFAQQQQQAKPAATPMERLAAIADDEYVTGAQLNQYLGQIRQQAIEEAMKQAKAGWEQYGQQAGQAILQNVFGVNQDYYALADQMFNLKLQQLYGLQPKENPLFDEKRIIDEANRLNLRDLQLVWNMLYGDARAKQAAEHAQQLSQQDIERIKKEAVEKAIQEERLRLHNANNPVLNGNGTPLPQFNRAPAIGYAQAEQRLREELAKLGVR